MNAILAYKAAKCLFCGSSRTRLFFTGENVHQTCLVCERASRAPAVLVELSATLVLNAANEPVDIDLILKPIGPDQ